MAVQVLLNCGGEDSGWGKAGNCHEGGSATSAYAWAKNRGYPSATCFPYAAEDGLGCSGDTICRNCMPTDHGEHACWAVPGDASDAHACDNGGVCATSPYPRIVVAEHGKLPGSNEIGAKAASEAIQREIVRAGPVTCNLDAEPLLTYTSGIAEANPPNGRGANDTDHVVEVVGWGVYEGKPEYWEIRNSWGEYWGEAGFGKVLRGRRRLDDRKFVHVRGHRRLGRAPGVSFQAASDDEDDAIELVSTPVSWVWEPAVGPVEPERAALVLLVAVVAFFVLLA